MNYLSYFYFFLLTLIFFFFFFFNDTATTEIYTLSLHDALPIFSSWPTKARSSWMKWAIFLPLCSLNCCVSCRNKSSNVRSEEHTSELQSRLHLVCRLLLEKKKKHRQDNHCIKLLNVSDID